MSSSHHHHGVDRHLDQRRLTTALILLMIFFVLEISSAAWAHSLVLFADAGHIFTDASALAVALWAAKLARRPATSTWTFGLFRAEILSAAANGVALAIGGIVIGVESVLRLVRPQGVRGGVVLVVAILGVLINLISARVLLPSKESNLNVGGAFAHIVNDLWAFIATTIAGIIIITTGFNQADDLASLVISALMLTTATRLLRDAGRILLEGAPNSVNLRDVRDHLLETNHVLGVHDLHSWLVTSDLPALSAHIVVEEFCFSDGHAPVILDQLQGCIADHFDVEHSTFQLEPPRHLDHESEGHA